MKVKAELIVGTRRYSWALDADGVVWRKVGGLHNVWVRSSLMRSEFNELISRWGYPVYRGKFTIEVQP